MWQLVECNFGRQESWRLEAKDNLKWTTTAKEQIDAETQWKN